MKKKILLTRPSISSQRWVHLLTARGYESVTVPLLRIEPTEQKCPSGTFQVVVLTSAHAANFLEAHKEQAEEFRRIPCYCVGEITGAAARAAGFMSVHCGESDGVSLAHFMTTALSDKTQALLHVCGDFVDNKMAEILTNAGYTLTLWPVYRAVAADDLTSELRDLLSRDAIGCIPVFSARSARVLVSLIEKNGLIDACSGIVGVALSQTVADVLQTVPWRRLCVAASPSEESVLACLEEIDLSDNHTTPPAPTPPSKPLSKSMDHAKKHRLAWGVLSVVVLVGIGAAAWISYPAVRAMILVESDIQTQQSANAQNIDALENRVHKLESDLKNSVAAPAIPALSATTPVEDRDTMAGLADSVKVLQAQVAQLQTEHMHDVHFLHKEMSALLAFGDVRRNADEGRDFSAALTALQSMNDDDIAPLLAALSPYAKGVTTCTQLREDLIMHEPDTDSAAMSESASWQDKARKIARTLISVRPLHSAAYDVLEKALEDGDASAALSAFEALPDNAQKNMLAWDKKLEARATVDSMLRTIEGKLAVPSTASGETP